MGPSDTSPEAERFLIEGYRRMSASDKLNRVFSLNRMIEQLQRARLLRLLAEPVQAGAQLLGHTLVNRVLRSISPTIVSVAILFEILGASLIARVAFGETPPAGAWPAGLRRSYCPAADET